MFQFLIGTLKTNNGSPGIFRRYAVSIPHRYAKNPLDDEYIDVGHEAVLITFTIVLFKILKIPEVLLSSPPGLFNSIAGRQQNK